MSFLEQTVTRLHEITKSKEFLQLCKLKPSRANEIIHAEDTFHYAQALWFARFGNTNIPKALAIASLYHDVERLFVDVSFDSTIPTEEYDLKNRVKTIDHPENSVSVFLRHNPDLPEELTKDISYLIKRHEIGGRHEASLIIEQKTDAWTNSYNLNLAADILMEADALSFFNFIIYDYILNKPIEKTKKKIMFSYHKLSEIGKNIVLNHEFGTYDVNGNIIDLDKLIRKTIRGKLIVIAGTDGVGKETQKNILIEKLKNKGYDLAIFDFPQYGESSARGVELYLIDEEFGDADEVGAYYASHHFAYDRKAKASEIREALNQGKVVVCNRYHTANFGHQGGKLIRHYDDLKERIAEGTLIPELEEFMDWVEDLEFNKYGLPKPDETVFLHAPIEICQRLKANQGARDHMRNLKLDGHERNITHLNFAYFSYLYTAQRKHWSNLDCQDYENPGNLLPIEDIHDRVYEQIQPLLPVLPS